MIYALQQVQARVNQVRGDLPAGLDIEVERLTPSLFPILSYNLEGGDPATLYDIARYQIKPLISRVPGVGRVDVQGSDVREIEVIADPARLAAQQLTYRRSRRRRSRRRRRSSAVGRMPQDYRQYLIVTTSEAHSADDIANIVVGARPARRDLATVTLGHRGSRAHHRRRRPAGGAAQHHAPDRRQHARDRRQRRARSRRRCARRCRRASILKPVYDQASLVRDAVKSVRDAMIIGAVLAVIILLLFLRHARITAISASSIPITMAITVFVMSLVGQTFNLMTLGAMAIAIGLVIDDAVVITENIVRHSHLQPDRHDRDSRRGAGADLAGDDVDDHDGRRLPAARAAHRRRRAVLPRAVDHADDRRARLARRRADDHSAAERAVPARRGRRGRRADGAAIGGARRRWRASGGAIDSLSDRYERALGASLRHARWMIAVALRAGRRRRARPALRRRPASCPRSTRARSCSTTSTPGRHGARRDRPAGAHRREDSRARRPEITGTSRRTGAELGLFATEQNRGDIVVRLKPESERDRSTSR